MVVVRVVCLLAVYFGFIGVPLAANIMPPMRTFLAFDLSPEVIGEAQRIIRRLSDVDASRVRWVGQDEMHLTMKFFGDIAPELSHEIYRCVQAVLDRWPPIQIQVEGVGAFPSSDRPRTIWAGVTQGAKELVDLASQIDAAVEPLGFRPERRRFRPHLTLGRVKGSDPVEPLTAAIQAIGGDHILGITLVDQLRLLTSRLGKGRPAYECLATLEMP